MVDKRVDAIFFIILPFLPTFLWMCVCLYVRVFMQEGDTLPFDLTYELVMQHFRKYGMAAALLLLLGEAVLGVFHRRMILDMREKERAAQEEK